MNAAISSSMIGSAEHIPYVTADEAYTLMQTSFARFMGLIKSLDPPDWSKPTACTAWDVHDMVAHQAGGYASGVSYGEMFRQYTCIPRRGQLPEDAINELQVRERANMSPADLIAELKQVGEKAIHNWAYGFRAVKWLAIPHPVGGFMSLRHLMWVIHSRDTWMHRLDICRATNHPFEQTPEHDGRINELVVLDTAKKLNKKLNGRAITLILTDIAGGTWKIGQGDPTVEMEMDMRDFNIFVSGRFSYEEGLQRARISGEKVLIENAFRDLLVLY
ncbi:MAG TPA: maleylpyruvate isomerase family mycothiol-dependent enzyme [Anaerolineales bacterium]|nr:maleylpyruvate isomerase family mycothiol-dependent enzyme [Anaerolineales bacterium]